MGAPHQAADVVRLLGVGRLLIQRVLLRQGGEGLRCQALVQQLLHRLVGEAQLVGQMNGDLSRGVPYHNLNYVLFSLIPIRDSGQRHAAHVDVDRLHRAAGHGLHRADDGLLGIFRHRGDGVAVLHRQIDVQHQGGAGHVDLHTLGALLGVLLVVDQVRDAAAHGSHHAGHALHIPDGAHGDGGNHFLGNVDAPVLLRQRHILFALAHRKPLLTV